MKLFLLAVFLTLYSNWVSAAADECGDPPAVINERVKGEVEVKADAISKILEALGFGAEYEKTREDIFSKYGDSNAARADQYLYFLVCKIVLRSTTMTDQEKWEKIENLIKMRSVMPESPTPTPGLNSPPEPQSDVVQADGATVTAEEFVRLTSSNLSSKSILVAT